MELEQLARSGGNVGGAAETAWEKTSLRPYVELFERHVEGLVKEGVRGRKGEFDFRRLLLRRVWRGAES